MTKYKILRKHPSTEMDLWEDLALPYTEASSPRSALSKAGISGVGEYVAVPVRSWKPLPVKVEQTTKVTIG